MLGAFFLPVRISYGKSPWGCLYRVGWSMSQHCADGVGQVQAQAFT
jgi:hypothetical protein